MAEARIKQVAGRGAQAQAVYKLKSPSVLFNRHLHMYNEEQIDRIKDHLRDVNHFFGYNVHPEHENSTGFFNYDYSLEANKKALETYKEY